MIEESILKHYQAQLIHVKKGHVLFSEGDAASYFFQLQFGSIKMLTYSDVGQEFIQGVFSDGESFGEPALIGDFDYPSAAVALKNSSIWRLSKENFFLLLKENFEVHLAIDRALCKRLKYKNLVLSEISFYDPEHRLTTIFKYLKDSMLAKKGINNSIDIELPFTRQQLADMGGMRVETAIRTIKRMEEEGKVKIKDGKILI
ncbi:MAG: Crp/Fnr family transcriptional regulator [Chitinophagaceae bacterium]|jgi:CRP-like cAMP-binding protein|nr:Crp/Fnr family transcriptional regulator [Chitinophagaceae bacterium]